MSDSARSTGAATPATDALLGSVLAGRYRIEKLLGSGGMGSVYRAEHVHMRKAVAIKVLHREMTYLPEVVARFEREAVAAARIEHANVAAATDFGRLDDGAFYLVLEYVEGQSLRALMKEMKRLPSVRALHIAHQIADALNTAHSAGIVHRDLKPDNVMLIDREGEPDFVKVLDFGIAKLSVEGQGQQQPLTQLGSIFGTPDYMAPEQAQGLPVDARADLYTVGVLLYEMVAGTTPFSDDDMVVVLTRQLTADPPPLPADVEPAFELLIRTLLAKAPEQRLPNAAELVRRIDELLDGGLNAPVSEQDAAALRSFRAAASGVQFSDTVLNLSGAGKPTATVRRKKPWWGLGIADAVTSWVESLGPLLRSSVAIGGQPVPVWAMLAFGTASVVALILIAALVMGDGGGRSLAGAARDVVGGRTSAENERELAALMERASRGDATALAQLTARPESERSIEEWRALGRGHAQLGQYPASLKAYEKALASDPKLSADAALLADVRAAAEDPAAAAGALQLAAKLGASGADLIHDVWSANRRNKANAEIAKLAKSLLESDALRRQASPALLIALDLGKPQACGSYKKLLPRAVEHADVRSAGTLKALTASRGCGFLGLMDCYGCLRGSKDLAAALKTAPTRAAPVFQATVPAPAPSQ
ncbi:MAG TPA: protein kinase [Polyangiaceae bacterium]|nr:protein kinase [Polyangiaceae bacterium]